MRRSSAQRLCLLALAIALTAGVVRSVAEGRVYTARVFLDRAFPERFVSVADFRINSTLPEIRFYDGGRLAARGVQYVILHSADGTFHVPFDAIDEIGINRPLGRSGDVARYDATIKLKQDRESRSGRIELRALQGSADSIPWHVLLTARDDRGANLHRIVFVD